VRSGFQHCVEGNIFVCLFGLVLCEFTSLDAVHANAMELLLAGCNVIFVYFTSCHILSGICVYYSLAVWVLAVLIALRICIVVYSLG
jgi:hypothetical protein